MCKPAIAEARAEGAETQQGVQKALEYIMKDITISSRYTTLNCVLFVKEKK